MDIDRTPAPIAALATAPGAAGVCVVRISGDGALLLGDRLVPAGVNKPSEREGGTFFHAGILHPQTQERLDDAVVLVYRAPNSYTGEDVLEIQGHGGSVPSRRLLDAVLAAGARLAEPGEFTKRAFLNGRMDLTQAEAVCDFIQSKTDRAAHVARSQLDGALGASINGLYARMTGVCADIEHLLDFDEGELPDTFLLRSAETVGVLIGEIETLAASWNEGHLLREGALVVISGRPNAGKSSLLNALLQRNRAIVHEVAGTTRDSIEESYSLEGVPLRLVDTAGLRDTHDEVEQEGIGRARALMRQADLNIHLIDATRRDVEAIGREIESLPKTRLLIGFSKGDAANNNSLHASVDRPTVRFSVRTGDGLDALKAEIVRMLELDAEAYAQPVVSLRQVTELREAVHQAQSAVCALKAGSDMLVIAAGYLRAAAEALGRIVGRVYSDDLLETVFSRFCVGK